MVLVTEQFYSSTMQFEQNKHEKDTMKYSSIYETFHLIFKVAACLCFYFKIPLLQPLPVMSRLQNAPKFGQTRLCYHRYFCLGTYKKSVWIYQQNK